MTRLHIILIMLLLLVATAAGATEPVEEPRTCHQCGMDRTEYAASRAVITHGDGATSGLCSLQCALEEARKGGQGQPQAVRVADYRAKNLIDAKAAFWVVGGSKPGGMNFPPKWAFATEAEARRFIKESGGELSSYDQIVRMYDEQVAQAAKDMDSAMSGHHHVHGGAGGNMLFNPSFSDDIYHVHPKGMWMANYKYMHMVMSGLRNGTTDVPVENATPIGNEPFGFMMAPTRMTMDMHMVMLMYGVTDRFSLMGMGTYLENRMDMVMNMGMGNRPDNPMWSNGIGDTEIRGIYQFTDTLTGSLGVSLPTGSIDEEFETMGKRFRLPYDMQLGSGTLDFKPALTYNVLSDDGKWNWGGQGSFTYHSGHNKNGYSLGDSAKLTGWGQRAFGPAAGWFRMAYNYTGEIRGRDRKIDLLLDPDEGAPTPDADPDNYGGHRIDGFIGTSYAIGPVSIGIEAGIPFYQHLNGLQLKNQWYLTAGIQGMF